MTVTKVPHKRLKRSRPHEYLSTPIILKHF